MRQRIEEDVDPEAIAGDRLLVEEVRVIAFALEGVAEVGVVGHQHDQPALLVEHAARVDDGALLAALGGLAARA